MNYCNRPFKTILLIAFVSIAVFGLSSCAMLGPPKVPEPPPPAPLKAEAWIPEWLCFGPFPDKEHSGLMRDWLTEAGGEAAFNPDDLHNIIATSPTLQVRVAGPNSDGLVDFNPLFDPNENTVAYAWAEIESPTDGWAFLRVGSDDGVRAWINGELIHANPVYRGAAADQEIALVRLRSGVNQCLLKINQGTGGWGFYARLSDVKPRAEGLHLRPCIEPMPPIILTDSLLPIEQVLHVKLFNDGTQDIEGATIHCLSPGLINSSVDNVDCPMDEIVDLELPLNPDPDRGLALFIRIAIEVRYPDGSRQILSQVRTTASQVHPLLRDPIGHNYNPSPFYVIQISDTHVIERDTDLAGVKTALRLRQVVDEINDLDPPPDFVVATGDNVMDSMRGYPTFRAEMDRLLMPWLAVFGNHDKPVGLAAAARAFSKWGLPEYYAFDHKGYRFFMLDSVVNIHPAKSEISPRQLNWLKERLADAPALREQSFYIHHDLFSGRGVNNYEQVQDVFNVGMGGIMWVFSGHWHIDCFVRWGNQRHVVTTTTAYQGDGSKLKHTRNEPGMRIIRFKNGKITIQFKPLGGGPHKDDPPHGGWHTPQEVRKAIGE